jgi:hypothetical protein
MISIFPAVTQHADDGDLKAKLRQERLGTDDGFVMTINYSADLHGNLDTCG